MPIQIFDQPKQPEIKRKEKEEKINFSRMSRILLGHLGKSNKTFLDSTDNMYLHQSFITVLLLPTTMQFMH